MFVFFSKDVHAGIEYVNSNLCKICLSKEATYITMECGHMSCCLECVTAVENCVICRKRISLILKVYKT